jgi:sugar lactone lactonase YvrE
MLGGPDGRTLFVATAPNSDPEKCRAARGGRIETTQVEVPRAGLP